MTPLLSVVTELPDTKANNSAITLLETVLEEARNGEVIGVAIATYDKGRRTHNRMVPGENPTLLLGAISALQYWLARYRDETP